MKVILTPCDQRTSEALELAAKKPFLVLSTLHLHETKISVQHFQIKRTDGNDSIVQQKEALEFHVGFRRFVIRPTLSEEIKFSDKLKMARFLQHD